MPIAQTVVLLSFCVCAVLSKRAACMLPLKFLFVTAWGLGLYSHRQNVDHDSHVELHTSDLAVAVCL